MSLVNLSLFFFQQAKVNYIFAFFTSSLPLIVMHKRTLIMWHTVLHLQMLQMAVCAQAVPFDPWQSTVYGYNVRQKQRSSEYQQSFTFTDRIMDCDWQKSWAKSPTWRDESGYCWDDKSSFTLLVLEFLSVLCFPNISVCAQPKIQLSSKILFKNSVSSAHGTVWLWLWHWRKVFGFSS